VVASESGTQVDDPFASDTVSEADAAVRRRIDSRDSMFLHATLRRAGCDDQLVLRVRNLSAGGMMAETPASFETGEAIEVNLRGIGAVAGRIAWCANGQVGIAFLARIDPKSARLKVAMQKRPLVPAAQARRPGFGICRSELHEDE